MSRTIKSITRYAVMALAALSASSAQAEGQRHLSVEQKPFYSLQSQQSGLEIETWIDSSHGVYRPGDTLELSIRLNKDAHVRVFNVDADGRSTLIYPNAIASNTLLSAGPVHRIPGRDAGYMLRVSPPFGLNLLQIVATTYEGDFVADIPYSQSGTFRDLQWAGSQLARHLQVVVDSHQADWTFSEQVFEVRPQRGAAHSFPSLNLPEGNFDLRLRLDDPAYLMGDPLGLTVYSQQDCQLTLLSYDSGGNWTLIVPNGWGPDRIRVQSGVTRVPEEVDYGGLWTGGQTSGTHRLLALCAEDGGWEHDYDYHLVREFMQHISTNGQTDHSNVAAVVDRLASSYAFPAQLAWAIADFEMIVD